MFAAYTLIAVDALQKWRENRAPTSESAAVASAAPMDAIPWLGASEADQLARGAAALLHRLTLPVARAPAVA